MRQVARLVVTLSKVPCRGMAVDIGGMRKPYMARNDTFDTRNLVAREPFAQFKAWFEEASKHEKIEEANAMCLATATPEGFPSARMVLLKKSVCNLYCTVLQMCTTSCRFGPEGFTFYTNYGSRKAGELDTNPRAALVFYWEALKVGGYKQLGKLLVNQTANTQLTSDHQT